MFIGGTTQNYNKKKSKISYAEEVLLVKKSKFVCSRLRHAFTNLFIL